MVFGLGLMKPRTRLGRYLDRNGITQGELERGSGISETTITKICNDIEYRPTEKTKIRIVVALREMDFDVYIEDFW